MNRSIVLLGVPVLLWGAMIVAAGELVASNGGWQSNALAAGTLLLSAGVGIALWGLASPNPYLTTVRGLFGNPDENELERRLQVPGPSTVARYLPSPRESVNCRYCYTAIPAQALVCPRCGRRRECRECGKRLFFLSGAVRCAPCIRDEVYCNCPRARRTRVGRVAPGRHRW
jgi:hypothetical protein